MGESAIRSLRADQLGRSDLDLDVDLVRDGQGEAFSGIPVWDDDGIEQFGFSRDVVENADHGDCVVADEDCRRVVDPAHVQPCGRSGTKHGDVVASQVVPLIEHSPR